MGEALDRCEFGPVTRKVWQGPPETGLAYRYGDFAARMLTDRVGWEIIHCPSGTSLPATFPDGDLAAKAMFEIQKLRNDWAVFELRSIDPQLRDAVAGRVRRNAGVWHPFGPEHGEAVAELEQMAAKVYPAPVNGYQKN